MSQNSLFAQQPLNLGAFWVGVNAAAHDRDRSVPLSTVVVVESVDTTDGTIEYIPVTDLRIVDGMVVISTTDRSG